jgi:hypothetical protein
VGEPEHVSEQLPKYNVKIPLGDVNVKLDTQICKLTIWNESLHEISNDNKVRVVNFTTYKI